MVTVLIRCRVADYDFWRPRYDTAVARDSGLGLRLSRVWRSQDDDHECRAGSDDAGKLHAFCPGCWQREFGAGK
jgi:hypothetical protein